MEREAIVWLALFVILLIVELLTVGLTSIWFAGGALAALVLELLGVDLIWQIGGVYPGFICACVFYETVCSKICQCTS